MAYRAFALYNVAGAAVWTLSFTLAGYFFGAPSKHFTCLHCRFAACLVCIQFPTPSQHVASA